MTLPRATPCPHCGAPIIPAGLRLPPTKARIFEAVRHRPGIAAEDLRAIVWAHDPNGGPECRHTIYAHIAQLNKLLAAYGIAVRAPKGAGAGYRIHVAPGSRTGTASSIVCGS
jgi:hypothetical protein